MILHLLLLALTVLGACGRDSTTNPQTPPSSITSRFQLIQATQSHAIDRPIPLVADRDALLRVFVTAEKDAVATFPSVRAMFYRDGALIHTENLPGRNWKVWPDIVRGSLNSTSNALIKGKVLSPGLEVVIEIDPDENLDPPLAIGSRIPPAGRLAVDVRDLPALELKLVPLLWIDEPDYSAVTDTEDLTGDDKLFQLTRELLPIGKFNLTLREPIWTSVDTFRNSVESLMEVDAVRVLDGYGNIPDVHYMGVFTTRRAGRAYNPGFASISSLDEEIIAHELGHNLSLAHSPCSSYQSIDPDYPYEDGSIGVWGYDMKKGLLVNPKTPDLMGRCTGVWISDYHFNKALHHRLLNRTAFLRSTSSPASRALLIMGYVSETSELRLEPAFAVNAPPHLPEATGPYRLTGEDADGRILFSLDFGMTEIADGAGRAFVISLPVLAEWADDLNDILLAGPEGSVAISDEEGRTAALLLDGGSDRVRGILRGWTDTSHPALRSRPVLPEPGLEIMISRGIPDADSWRQ